jgi:putative peptidoglycan lipid II flippase
MARAATLIAAGNVVSRVLGLARETVIANLFGASGLVSAFRVAQIIPIMLYDLLVGGMVSSALVPIFSEQAERDRAGLWHLASLVLSLAVVVLGVIVLIVELAAPQIPAVSPAISPARSGSSNSTILVICVSSVASIRPRPLCTTQPPRAIVASSSSSA